MSAKRNMEDVFLPPLQSLHEGSALDGFKMTVEFTAQGPRGFLALDGGSMVSVFTRRIEFVIETATDGTDVVSVKFER